MISFKKFIMEKDVSNVKEPTLYISCELPKEYWNMWANVVDNLNEADEIETEPHCTWLWCLLEEDYDEQMIYDLLKDDLSNVNFNVSAPNGFELFKGVSDGTQNCLVVRLDSPKEIIELQNKTMKILKDGGIRFKQTFPDWKPHMTIAYFPTDIEVVYSDPSDELKKHDVEASIDYMSVSKGERIKF